MNKLPVEQLQSDTPPYEATIQTKPLFDKSRHRVGIAAIAAVDALYEKIKD